MFVESVIARRGGVSVAKMSHDVNDALKADAFIFNPVEKNLA